jgi:hypothetical protein
LTGSEAWDDRLWGETIGSVACKHANYQIATSGHGMGVKRGNYEKSVALRQNDAEWLAFVYHVETSGEFTVVPFDQILIARPIWIRSRHPQIQTTDEFSVEQVGDLHNRSRRGNFRNLWQRRLSVDERTDGWPLYLYRLALKLRGIESDL